MAEAIGHVGVYESSDGGSGNAAETLWAGMAFVTALVPTTGGFES